MKKKKISPAYYFLIPWVIGFLVFKLYPAVMTVYYSLTNYNIAKSPKFIGFDNYKELFTTDPVFIQSLMATFKYVLITVPLALVFGLFIAYILNFKLKGVKLFRTAYYIPSILGANVAIAVLWKALFGNDGLVNSFLGLFNIAAIPWLTSPDTAIITLSILRLWQFGSMMVIFLAALQAVSPSLYEAARIDGASKWAQFTKITIPIISPVILFNGIMALIGAFQEFNAPYIITKGGPLNSTYFLNMYVFDTVFLKFRMGFGSAIAMVLVIIIAIFTAIVFKLSSKSVFYSD
ncbi:MAG: carbohydrate ABC transporter permease [Culicoidibacterales bacterium]